MPLAATLVAERLSVDKRHDVIKERVGLSWIEQRQDMRMLKIGGGRGLLDEPFGPEHGGQLWSHCCESRFIEKDVPECR